MKKSALRSLRSAFLATHLWSVHETALTVIAELLAAHGPLPDMDAAAINAAFGLSPRSETESTVQMVGSTAVIPIYGVIQQRPSWLTRYTGWTATEQFERDVTAAAMSDQVKAIVLYCDSPGGVASGIDEAAAKVFAVRNVKPIVAFARGLMCSACYHLGSAAKSIIASTSSTIGSIGAIYTHVEYADMLAKAGIGVSVIKHGSRKGDGNPYEKLSPASKASLQKWVSSFGDLFDAAVAKFRNVSVETVRAKFGQGESFIAAEAKDRGLIDAVGTWEQVLSQLGGGALPQPAQQMPHAEAQRRRDSGSVAAGSFDSLAFLGASAPLRDALSLPVSPASVLPADVSSGPVVTPANTPGSQERNTMKVSARVRAALFARGLISAQDVDDTICVVAINCYFVARGEACPQANEDDKVIAGLMAAPAKPAASAETPAGGAAANVQAAHDRELAEARAQGSKTEAERQKLIRASAELLSLDATAVQAAIDGGKSHADVVAGWHADLAKKEKPIGQQSIKVGQEGIERYIEAATTATLVHIGRAVPDAQLTPEIRQLANAPLHVHAERCLQAAGVRLANPYDREEIAERAMAMDGIEKQTIRADIPYNRPGSFPNLLSNLANKILDEGVEMAEVTYPEWTGVWPGDLPDFKPAPVIGKSAYGETDEVLDAAEFEEQGLAEECLSYMQLARFGNKASFTPILLANDDLNSFTEDLLGLSDGWELRQNRNCLSLITGNVTLLNGNALYDNTNHGNHISSGGAPPGDAEWDAHEVKMAAQTVIGGKAYARTRLAIALVPPALFRAALQAFSIMRDIGEMKQPATDSNLNIYRGKVTVVREPELTATSAVEWYSFADPRRFRNATVVRAYFRGFGRKGKRERWYDPNTKCYCVSLEGRFGCAVKNYRTTIKDKGAA